MTRSLKIIVGLVSLACVLAYNWTHTGGLLASYVRPEFVGYVAATGIEIAVVGLSLRIADLRRNKSGATFQVATLAAVVVVSMLANVAEGYAVKFGEAMTSANIGRLDIVQAIVSLSATGLLSLVTFAIAEIVGGDIEQARNQETQAAPLVETPAVLVPHVAPQDEPQAQPLRPLDRLDVIKFWQAHTARGGNGYADVADIAHETLNGRSANLAAWYDGKQSIASLAEALGADEELTRKIGGWVRFGAGK